MVKTHLQLITNDGFSRLEQLVQPSLNRSCTNQTEALEILQLLEISDPDLLPQALQALGYELGEPGTSSFFCPLLNSELSTSCGNRNCSYWVDYNPSDNCVLAHMKKHALTEMTSAQISYLTKWHPSAVSKLLNKALTKLRGSSVPEAISTGHLEPDFVFVTRPGVCCVCEQPKEPAMKVDDLMWCSPACWSKYGACEMMLERKFNVKVDKLMRYLAQEFGSWDTNISLLADAVGVKSADLGPVWEKYKKIYQLLPTPLSKDVLEKLKNPDLSPLAGLGAVYADRIGSLDEPVDLAVSAQALAEFEKLDLVVSVVSENPPSELVVS